jgi:radical SAM protein with 4Fe4S-binding SPASM domain
LERIIRILSSYQEFKIIGITGGEPYLRDDLFEVLRAVASTQKNLRSLFITTNGQLEDKASETAERFLKDRSVNWRFDTTHLVSIDGPAEIHEKIRGVAGAHKRALRTVQKLSQLTRLYPSFHLGTVTVCSPYNIDRFDEVLDHISDLKKQYGLEPSFCVWFEGQLYRNVGKDSEAEPSKFRQKLIKHIPRMKTIVRGDSAASLGRSMFYDLLSTWLKKPSRQIVPCGGARIRYFLDPYGNVYPCTIFDHKAGSLEEFDGDFRRFLESDSRRRTRNLVKTECCPICCNTCETIPAMMANPFHTMAQWARSKLEEKVGLAKS